MNDCWLIPVFAVAEQEQVSVLGGVPINTWIQIGQALVALVNLFVVVYVFRTTRRDKRDEMRMSVDSFWLQKVIVEPYSKQIDELCSALEALLKKCRNEARAITGSGATGCQLDEAMSSHAHIASQNVEKLRLAVVPLLTIVVDKPNTERDARPSVTIDQELDAIDEATTRGIASLFKDPGRDVSEIENQLRDGRLRLLRVLFQLHKHPFESSR
jgi:hypothetical protein